MESFQIAVDAVVPFLIYISFGYLVRKSGMAEEAFMKKLNQIVFKAFFPIIMFYNIYDKEEGVLPDSTLVYCAISSVMILVVLLFLIVPCVEKKDERRGVIIQALYRSNFVLFAIPLTESLYGAEGRALASMMVAVVIPMYNILAIVILEYFRGGKLSILQLIKKVFSNPMIFGTLAGFVAIAIDLKLPHCIEVPVAQFANMTTPLALFILGGTLHFSAVKSNAKLIFVTMVTKLILLSAIVIVCSVMLGMDAMNRFIWFTMFATPVATASYSMAANMGGDGELAGQYVVVSTAASVGTIFLWIVFMKNVGLL